MRPRAYILIETDLGMSTRGRKPVEDQTDQASRPPALCGPYDVVALVEGDSHNAIGRLVEKIQATPGCVDPDLLLYGWTE